MFPLDFFTRIMAEEALDDVLWHSGVYQAGPERVAQLVGGDGYGVALFVMEVYAPLPGPQLAPEGMVVKRERGIFGVARVGE